METVTSKSDTHEAGEANSPPRSSDSDWSDIDSDEEKNLTDDDEDTTDKLLIDIPKKHKRLITTSESQDHSDSSPGKQ